MKLIDKLLATAREAGASNVEVLMSPHYICVHFPLDSTFEEQKVVVDALDSLGLIKPLKETRQRNTYVEWTSYALDVDAHPTMKTIKRAHNKTW